MEKPELREFLKNTLNFKDKSITKLKFLTVFTCKVIKVDLDIQKHIYIQTLVHKYNYKYQVLMQGCQKTWKPGKIWNFSNFKVEKYRFYMENYYNMFRFFENIIQISLLIEDKNLYDRFIIMI